MDRDDENSRARRVLLAALDAAAPEDRAGLREELRQAGLDPVLVRARQAALVDTLLAGGDTGLGAAEHDGVQDGRPSTVPRVLPWFRQEAGTWVSDPVLASDRGDSRSWLSLDFSRAGLYGRIKLVLWTSTEADGSRALHVEWEANFFHRPGFRLSLYRLEEQHPFLSREVGNDYSGSLVLTAEAIGLDPALVPLKFAFEPITEKPG